MFYCCFSYRDWLFSSVRFLVIFIAVSNLSRGKEVSLVDWNAERLEASCLAVSFVEQTKVTGCIVDRFLVIFIAVSYRITGEEVANIILEAEILEALCLVVSFVDSAKVVFTE